MKNLFYIFFLICLIFALCSKADVYYTSPTGTAKDLATARNRDTPANWRWITQYEGARQLKCGDSVLLRWDQGIYTEGTRIYATGCSDTYNGAIHYLSEPGGFAIFRINKYPQDNFRHIDRKLNPDGIAIGGEYFWKSSDRDPITGWNSRSPDQSKLGRYVWLREIVMQGNYGTERPIRDLSTTKDIPYGSTGKRAPGTLAGSQNYDNMTGFISIRAYGCRVINCLFWNLGKSGIGVNSSLRQGNATFYGNIVTNTGHSSPERDRFHSVYQQWHEDNQGRLIHKHNIYQFSAEEGLQIWAQSGIDSRGRTKIDNVDIIENVLINGGTLSGAKHKGRSQRNALVGGYTYDNDIRIIGNISWHDRSSNSWQSGFSANGNNDRRNFYFKNNYLAGGGVRFMNITSIKDVSGNTFVRLSGDQLNFEVAEHLEDRLHPTIKNWNNNQFYGGGNIRYLRWVMDKVLISNKKLSFEAWQKMGFDKISRFYSGYPDDEIKYVVNEYLDFYDTNLRGHFVVLNWSEKKEVQISVDRYDLQEGDKFRVIDVQNIAGDLVSNYIYEGNYSSGMTVMVPTEQSEVVPDITGEMVGPYHTDRRFFSGLVVRITKAGQKPAPDPLNAKILGAKIIGGNCTEILTEGDIDRVEITPVDGRTHTENNAPWTICPRDMGQSPAGIVTFNIKAYDHRGRSIEKQLNVDYSSKEPAPVEPTPADTVKVDYVTKQHFDSLINLILFNQRLIRDSLIKQNAEILKNREWINRKRTYTEQ